MSGISVWALKSSAVDNSWRSVCYGFDLDGKGIFVAVSNTGTGNRVMTSYDGANWSSQSSAADNSWYSVCYGINTDNNKGLFVAVGTTGTGNRVMTSPDGYNWTSRASAADNKWKSVCYGKDRYGKGIFVAVAISGIENRVMTSYDGITWTLRRSAFDNDWYSVCYGKDSNGDSLFVAVANTGPPSNPSDPSNMGTQCRVMISPDGITWVLAGSDISNAWSSVCYGTDSNGHGVFVAVSQYGYGNGVMISKYGFDWNLISEPGNMDVYDWNSVCYGNNLFVAVNDYIGSSSHGAARREMTSRDGINWTPMYDDGNLGSDWKSVCYGNNSSGNGIFVAVGTGIRNRVMIATTEAPTLSNFSIQNMSVPSTLLGHISFNITDPSSNSIGSFSYSSSNSSVAIVDGNTIKIVGVGNSTITATQAATILYTSGTITTTINVSTLLTSTVPSVPACFNEGTKILCLNKKFEEEYIPVENLRKGDLVKSYKHGYRKIELIGKNSMINNPDIYYECIYKMEKTDSNGLTDDLMLTGAHSVLLDDLQYYQEYKENVEKIFNEALKIDDKYLLLSAFSKDFVKMENNDEYTYYHFCLENNGDDNEIFGVWTNGILTETTSKNEFTKQKFVLL